MSPIQQMTCPDVERFIDAYVDRELVDEEQVGVERHLAECTSCAKQVHAQAAFKVALRATAPRPVPPAALRARVLGSLERQPTEMTGWQRALWRAVPATAAALLLVGLVIQHRQSSPVAAEAIDTFRSDLPLDVTGPADAVQAWLNPRVNFAVRPPRLPDAALVGARVSNIGPRRAAYLAYNVRGNRVSVIVFDPADVPIEARHYRQVDGRVVYLDGDRGYNVALVRAHGVAYAFASDLDEEQMIHLVSSAMSP